VHQFYRLCLLNFLCSGLILACNCNDIADFFITVVACAGGSGSSSSSSITTSASTNTTANSNSIFPSGRSCCFSACYVLSQFDTTAAVCTVFMFMIIDL
jgi:hypothetical protein